MRKIKIGQIGVGHNHGEAKMLSVRRLYNDYEVVGYAEPDEEWFQKRGHLKCYDGIPLMTVEELLAIPDLEAVMVEPAVPDLMKIARMCIDRGVHIHLDKPAGLDLEEYRGILRDAKAKNLIVQLGLLYRSNPAVQDALKKAQSGELGEIYHMDCHMSSTHTLEYRQYLTEFPCGLLYIFSCHLVDLILSVMGMPDKVIPFVHSTGKDMDVIDNCAVALVYPKGTSFIRISSVEVNGWGRRQLVICGEKGTVQVQPLEKPIGFQYTRAGVDGGRDNHISEGYAFSIGDRYVGQMRDFAKMIRGEMENPYSWEHEYKAQLINLAACGLVEYEKLGDDFVL